ncbi:huntingtin-interacting protein 1 isoform X2 [Culicoides brevitarsis]|uniref:huntingtin-interacting protein 1 isoform X2 n=1 Tax=Culicoides brevitarsis TaxID=469753 RepID=UPI00307BE808
MAMNDKDYYHLTISIQKAVNGSEQPIKPKHIRAAIIGTYQSKGGQAFWAIAIRQPLQENRLTAWKFCHLLHKVLREGHPLVNQHSMRHRHMLTEAGKLWGHLNDGYGICIKHYTKLIVTKLTFHDRNPAFPGHLQLKRGELERIGGGDNNFYFDIITEMFDYLDDIVALQATIFDSITKGRVNSMTPPGQCRLAPLIPLIQDSNPLYDHCVRIMFRLHNNLPADLLTGHRDRFRTLFHQLKSFYSQTRVLQYFENLITVPKLPENPPNFLMQSDFGNYTAPVVVMPDESPVVEDLVDTNFVAPVSHSPPPAQQPELPPRPTPPASATPSIDFEKLIQERDNLIQHLQMELERKTKFIQKASHEQREQQLKIEEHIANLASELSQAKEEMTNMRIEKQELELRAQTAPTLEQKAHEEEERAKATEEKFQKLKTMYTQIRDEHVKLLRQHKQLANEVKHGEVSKKLAATSKQMTEADQSKEEMRCQLEELKHSQTRAEEKLQQSSAITEEIEKLKAENEILRNKTEELEAARSAEVAELKISLDQLREEKDSIFNKYQESLCSIMEKDDILSEHERLKMEHSELQTKFEKEISDREKSQNELNEQLTQEIAQKEALQTEFEQKIIEITREKEKLEALHNENQSEIDLLASQLKEKTACLIDLETTSTNDIQGKAAEVEELKKKIEELEKEKENLSTTCDRLSNDKATLELDLQDLLHQQEQLEEKLNLSIDTNKTLENVLQDTRIKGDAALRALLETCVKESEKIAMRSINDNEMSRAGGTPSYFLMIAEEVQDVLTKLSLVHNNYQADSSANVEALARKIILGGHLLASAHVQGMAICASSADIECGIAEEIKDLDKGITNLFKSLHTLSEASNVPSQITEVKEKLEKVTNMIGDLSKKTDSTELLAEMVESELAGMDKAIEEAASRIADMLSQSRASDSGIKLEVNEKILDACTSLMQCIRILVQKSRILQEEIISLGKGTQSAKEFYKRNHQWTEGLISAAKSVAQGANFLVTAANKTVTGEVKNHFDLVVAAQEIAASTAQLVVASRVKAQRQSPNLTALGQASKNVTQATGGVVAVAKDCTARLEEQQDDLTGLTLHQAKTREMEVQVKVLELEQALNMERLKLAALRRKNYQANGDDH